MITTALYIALGSIVCLILFLAIIAYLMISRRFQKMNEKWMIPLAIIGGPIMWAVCLGIIFDGIKKKLLS